MKSFKKVLIALAAACCLALQFVAAVDVSTIERGVSVLISGQFYTTQYKQINKYLESKVNSNDVGLNLKAAQQYLDSEFSDDVSILKRPLVEALKQFLALKQVANKCDMDAYAILYKNHKGSSAFAHKDESKFGPMRQIDNVIYQVAMEHAKKCQSVYEEEFKSRQSIMDGSKLKAIEAFAQNVLIYSIIQEYGHVMNDHDQIRKWFGQGVINLFVFNKKTKKMQSLKEKGPLAYRALEVLLDNNSEQQYLGRKVNSDDSVEPLNRLKVTELYKAYIVEPCKYYVNELSDLFERAKFDAMWSYEPRNCLKDVYEEFYKGWGSFEVCKRLLERDQNSLLKGVLSIASGSRQ